MIFCRTFSARNHWLFYVRRLDHYCSCVYRPFVPITRYYHTIYRCSWILTERRDDSNNRSRIAVIVMRTSEDGLQRLRRWRARDQYQ